MLSSNDNTLFHKKKPSEHQMFFVAGLQLQVSNYFMEDLSLILESMLLNF
jgi:hypothetical protein